MLEINLDGALPTHVERIKPNMSVGETGELNWTPAYLDYNAANYYPGKTVRSEEFNKHILQQIYQGNYNTDVMKEVFNKHLPDMVYKAFSSEFKLRPSYVKVFTETDWGERQEDGYYYITITPEVHGFVLENTEQSASSITVDTEMYMLNTDNKFYEVMQALVQPDNTVQIYTDDATTPGFVIVRLNDKSLSVAQVNIHANQIIGLHKAAISGKYSDLVGLSNEEGTGPEDKINANKESIEAIISGEDKYFKKVTVKNAIDAENAMYATNLLASGNIQNIKVLDIFETGSNYVKDATHAKQADDATNVTTNLAGKALTDIFEADGLTVKKATNADKATKDAQGNNIFNSYARLSANNTFTGYNTIAHLTVTRDITSSSLNERLMGETLKYPITSAGVWYELNDGALKDVYSRTNIQLVTINLNKIWRSKGIVSLAIGRYTSSGAYVDRHIFGRFDRNEHNVSAIALFKGIPGQSYTYKLAIMSDQSNNEFQIIQYGSWDMYTVSI